MQDPARSRVRVSIATLRGLELRDFVPTRDGGSLGDPIRCVEIREGSS